MAEGVVLVTGGNSGIGFECARELARRGSRVLIASRNQQASDEAVRRIGQESGGLPSWPWFIRKVNIARDEKSSGLRSTNITSS